MRSVSGPPLLVASYILRPSTDKEEAVSNRNCYSKDDRSLSTRAHRERLDILHLILVWERKTHMKRTEDKLSFAGSVVASIVGSIGVLNAHSRCDLAQA